MKQKTQVQRVCIVETVYCLLLYLLYSTKEEIENTCFFIGDVLQPLFSGKKFHFYAFKRRDNTFLRMIFKISLRCFSCFRWNFLKTAKIFGQDHIQFFSGLAGNRKYTLLEDSATVFSSYFNTVFYKKNKQLRESWKGNMLKLLYGKTFAWEFGQSNQCENIILTKESDLKFLGNRQTTLFDLEKFWQNASKEKQELILNLFDLDLSESFFSNPKNIIIFTQPFYVDIPGFSKQEQIDLYREVVEDYPQNEIVIKVHPRDKINYHTYFPDTEIFNKPIPMQLISLLGVRFEKAVTFSSSSVLSFPYEIEVKKIGISSNKKLEEFFGKLN